MFVNFPIPESWSESTKELAELLKGKGYGLVLVKAFRTKKDQPSSGHWRALSTDSQTLEMLEMKQKLHENRLVYHFRFWEARLVTRNGHYKQQGSTHEQAFLNVADYVLFSFAAIV